MGKRVAVVGASRDRAKFGNKAVRAFAAAGHTVFPITPKAAEVEGLRAYRSVLDVDGPIDMVTVYVPPSVVLQLFDEFAAKHVPEIWLNPGADTDDVLAEARHRGLPVIAACSIMGIGRRPSDF